MQAVIAANVPNWSNGSSLAAGAELSARIATRYPDAIHTGMGGMVDIDLERMTQLRKVLTGAVGEQKANSLLSDAFSAGTNGVTGSEGSRPSPELAKLGPEATQLFVLLGQLEAKATKANHPPSAYRLSLVSLFDLHIKDQPYDVVMGWVIAAAKTFLAQ